MTNLAEEWERVSAEEPKAAEFALRISTDLCEMAKQWERAAKESGLSRSETYKLIVGMMLSLAGLIAHFEHWDPSLLVAMVAMAQERAGEMAKSAFVN